MWAKYVLATTFYHVIVAQIPKKSKSSPPAATYTVAPEEEGIRLRLSDSHGSQDPWSTIQKNGARQAPMFFYAPSALAILMVVNDLNDDRSSLRGFVHLCWQSTVPACRTGGERVWRRAYNHIADSS